MINSLSFKYKIIICMFLVSIIPLAVTSFFLLNISKKEFEKEAFEKLVAIRESKNTSITRYLGSVSSQVITLSHDKMIVDATKEFISAFKKLPPATDEFKKSVKEYYLNSFGKEYKSKTGKDSPLDKVTDDLSTQSLMIQHAFISNNPNALGSKHLLDDSPLLPEYSGTHKIYHPIIREFLERFELYDVFIVDNETGNIVYSVFKELDFSTNLLNGPYKDTNLANVFKDAQKIADKNTYKVVDFQKYAPSYEAPASFIASPIWDGDKKIGVLIFQMPLGTINKIMSERSGLGKTGETFLVGADKRLRSDAFNNSEMNIFNSFNKDKLINSSSVEIALANKPGTHIVKNYDGKEVLSAYTKLNYAQLPWVVLAEVSVEEAFQTAVSLKQKVILFILILVVIVFVVSLIVTKNLSGQIETIVERFSASAHDVNNSSQKMDIVSSMLYKSVQVQISSITETTASMEEISAMLKNNTQSSMNATELSATSKDVAFKGKDIMVKMIDEVKQISKSYDEIQASLDQNNEDNEKIVRVISEIGQKTKIINEIVFQTKLLSFNASVEAARAGESGKGFAVVAQEIANLAAMSGKASNDISEMLAISQEQVRELSETTKTRINAILLDGRGRVLSGCDIADECMHQLDKILENVNKLDDTVKEITSAISEQATGVEEVNSAMRYLENATHETTNMSEQSKTASNDLKNQSQGLRESIQELRKILGSKKSYFVKKTT